MVSREAVLAKASEWVGMTERTGNNDIWFADDWGITGQSWCFAFVQSCFYYADPSPSGRLPHQSMYCPYGIQWARDHGESIEVGGAPIPGDIVFYTWGNGYGRWTPGTGDHVGIVESWDGGDTINTIEGNVGPRDGVSQPQGVWRRTRSISGTVVCFWRPTVYGGDTLGAAAIPEEEDVTPEQAKKLDEIRDLVGGAFDQAVAANNRLDASKVSELRDYVGGTFDQVVAANKRLDGLGQHVDAVDTAVRGAFDTLATQVKALTHGEPVVDVEASIKQATPAQLASLGAVKLLAAVNELLATQPKPPVSPPADAESDAPAVG